MKVHHMTGKHHQHRSKCNRVSFDMQCLAGKWNKYDKEKRAWLIADMLDRLRIERTKKKKVTIPSGTEKERIEVGDEAAIAYWLGMTEANVKRLIKEYADDIAYRNKERTRLYALALDPSIGAEDVPVPGDVGAEGIAMADNECRHGNKNRAKRARGAALASQTTKALSKGEHKRMVNFKYRDIPVTIVGTRSSATITARGLTNNDAREIAENTFGGTWEVIDFAKLEDGEDQWRARKIASPPRAHAGGSTAPQVVATVTTPAANAAARSRQPLITSKSFFQVGDPFAFPNYSVARLGMKYQVMAIYPVDPTKTGPQDEYRVNVYEIKGHAPSSPGLITEAIQRSARVIDSGHAPSLKKARYWLYHKDPAWKNMAKNKHKSERGMVNPVKLAEAARLLKDDDLAPGDTEIWYMTSDFFMSKGRLILYNDKDPIIEHAFPKTVTELKKTHGLVGKVKATDPNTIFWKMQGEHWGMASKTRQVYLPEGVGHTSMMVGDIIRFPSGKALIVEPGSGFKETMIPGKAGNASPRDDWITYKNFYIIPSVALQSHAVWRINPHEYVGRGDTIAQAKQVADLVGGGNHASTGFTPSQMARFNAWIKKNVIDKGLVVGVTLTSERLAEAFPELGETKRERLFYAKQIVTRYKHGSRENHATKSTGKPTTRGIHVRVRPPGKKAWQWFARKKDGTYVATKPGKGRQFSYLDVGDLKKPGLQGLAYLVGFPTGKKGQIAPGTAIAAKKFRVQKIYIEKAALGLPGNATKKKLVKAIKDMYGKQILGRLKHDGFTTITSFRIVTKNKDYQLEMVKQK